MSNDPEQTINDGGTVTGLQHDDKHAIIAAIANTGFCILPSFLSAFDLAHLRADCDRVVAAASPTISSCIYEPVNTQDAHTSLRTHPATYGAARQNDHVLSLLLGRTKSGKRLMELVRVVLGDEVYVLNEQYVVKPPISRKRSRDGRSNTATAFKWHRDADYLRQAGIPRPEPSISVWCALDDVNDRNGTLVFAPLDNAQERVVVQETAGTVVLIASEVLHHSNSNKTARARRVWMPQYSAGPQRWEIGASNDGQGSACAALAIGIEHRAQRGGIKDVIL
jgi:ectoine hydroxylase-related dioxygenase (phytanoyl-CoA dioxygenase family)